MYIDARLIGKGGKKALVELPTELIAAMNVGVNCAVDGFCEWEVFANPGTQKSANPQRCWWRESLTPQEDRRLASFQCSNMAPHSRRRLP